MRQTTEAATRRKLLLSKTLAEQAGSHGWAYGCGQCRFGLVYAPEVNRHGSLSLYMQRAAQAANHDVEFCACQAGQQMQAYLRRVWATELKGRADVGAIRQRVAVETHVPSMRFTPGAG